MAHLESLDIPLGTRMPKFILRDPAGVVHVSDSIVGSKGLLVVFTCNHCPYAKAVWPRVIHIGTYALTRGINVIAINPNIHPNYPDDAPAEMQKKIEEWKIPFPYLIDEAQTAAKEFQAQCTPDIFLFDSGQKLIYHGRIDDNWQDEAKVTKQDLKQAITGLAEGTPIAINQIPSMGCSIKWRE